MDRLFRARARNGLHSHGERRCSDGRGRRRWLPLASDHYAAGPRAHSKRHKPRGQ
jgi:hypothetical protein